MEKRLAIKFGAFSLRSFSSCVCKLEFKMSAGRFAFNSLFRRTSTFAISIVVGAFMFERLFDPGMDALWERMNDGVSIENGPVGLV